MAVSATLLHFLGWLSCYLMEAVKRSATVSDCKEKLIDKLKPASVNSTGEDSDILTRKSKHPFSISTGPTRRRRSRCAARMGESGPRSIRRHQRHLHLQGQDGEGGADVLYVQALQEKEKGCDALHHQRP